MMERLTFGYGTKKNTAQSEVLRLNADAGSAGAARDAGQQCACSCRNPPLSAEERRDWAFLGLMVFTAVLFFRPQDLFTPLRVASSGRNRRPVRAWIADREPAWPGTASLENHAGVARRSRLRAVHPGDGSVLRLDGRGDPHLHRSLRESGAHFRADGEHADLAQADRAVHLADRDRQRLHRGTHCPRLRARHPPDRERPRAGRRRRHVQESERPGAQHGRDPAARRVLRLPADLTDQAR